MTDGAIEDIALTPLPLSDFAGCWARRRFGTVTVTALCDGHMGMSIAAFPNGNETDGAAMARRAGLDPAALAVSVSAFALQTGDRTWLVDAGTGNVRGDGVGHLSKALAGAGIAPGSIDAVLMTHMHVDHAAGLFLDGAAVFPNAELWMSEAEHAFWTEPGRAYNALQLTQLEFNVTALRLYAERVRTFPAGAAIAPGIVSIPLPGHTPGMTGYLVGDAPERALIWGDVVHMAAFQCARPDWSIRFDNDPMLAAKTRIGTFEQAILEDLTVTGAHVPFPGFASITREGEAYRYRPHTREDQLRKIVRDGGADVTAPGPR
jgi:glyoxylase-like metal-dependent hydrolase (beta-lactamase superfamily II)